MEIMMRFFMIDMKVSKSWVTKQLLPENLITDF